MNSVKYIFLLLIIFLSCDDIGKDYKWRGENPAGFTRHFGTKGYDYGWSGDNSPLDGGFIISGTQSKEIHGETNLWAIKTDQDGLLEWERTFGGNENEDGYDVTYTKDGGFLFVGHTWSFGNRQQMYAIKTDNFGNLEWEKTYGGSMWEVGNSVIQTKSGDYIFAGYSNSPGISSGNTDFYLVKIDLQGNQIWQKAHGSREFPNHEQAQDIIELQDEGFLVVGFRDRYDQGGKNGLIVRFDKDGNFLWEKEIADESNRNEIIYSISETSDGQFFLCSKINKEGNNDEYFPRIIKMDSYGNIGWIKDFKSNSSLFHQFRATATKSKDLVIVGSSTNILSSGYNTDAFMIRLDQKGKIIWSEAYGTFDHDDLGWSVFESDYNNLIIVGSTKSYGASLFDILLIRTDAEGRIE